MSFCNISSIIIILIRKHYRNLIGSYTKHEKVHFSHDNMSFVCYLNFLSCIIKFREHVKYLLIILRNVLNIYIVMFVKLVYEIINYDNNYVFLLLICYLLFVYFIDSCVSL